KSHEKHPTIWRISLLGSSLLLISMSTPTAAQPRAGVPSGQTVLTFTNRLLINPPQVLVFGYFATIQGLPEPLFSGPPAESTAYFTWSLNATRLEHGFCQTWTLALQSCLRCRPGARRCWKRCFQTLEVSGSGTPPCE